MRRHAGHRARTGHRPDQGGITALRHDLMFAVGVLADAVRGRPFAS